MRPYVKNELVSGGPMGSIIPHVGRYAREAVITAFEMNGGVEWLRDWAAKNPDDYFKSLFTKVITREVEVGASEGVEELLRRLDSGEHAQVIEGNDDGQGS